jgi:hypothetical protein
MGNVIVYRKTNMAKSLVALIILPAVLVFIGGCPPVEPELAEPPEVEAVKAEPADVEPAQVEPSAVAPVQAEPDRVEPVHVEPAEIEPNELELAEPEPNDVEPGRAEPNEPELPQAELDEPGPDDIQPEAVEPNEPKQDAVPPAEPEPNEVEPTGVEPNNVEPVEVEPNELDPEPAASFYDKCAGILKNFVDGKGMVEYKALRGKRYELRALLEEFSKLDPSEYKSWPREDKIAFWINTYNLQKLKVVTDNYPIKSSRILRVWWGPTDLRHIEEKITRHKFLVMDEEFTFAAIEKRFFRGEFDEPRIFLAISDACLSSPPLRNEPYYGHKLNKQLDDQAKRFLSSPLALRIDRAKQRVYLSAIFQAGRYGGEFVDKFGMDKKFKDHEPVTRAVLNFITNYISESDVSFLEVGNYSVKHMAYNWTINDGS